MILYPAIDIREGVVVRLQQGNYAKSTVYAHDVLEVAASFAEQGATHLHVVDLDGARSGERKNTDVILRIVRETSLRVQCGGGIRDDATARTLLDGGVARVVLGTAAITHPDLVSRLATAFPGQVVVGIDARDGAVATQGWETRTDQTVADTLDRFSGLDIAFVVTDIARDGMLGGPDIVGLTSVLEATSRDVVASGGVSCLDDLRRLVSIRVGQKRIAGVIVGRAIYENQVSIGDALQTIREAEADRYV